VSGEGPPRSAEDIERTRAFIEKAFGPSTSYRSARDALAIVEKRLALCESLLRQLAAGEPVGELVRAYFEG